MPLRILSQSGAFSKRTRNPEQTHHAYPPCHRVVKGRKGRFSAHFRSFPLIQVGRWGGGGGGMGAIWMVLVALSVILQGRWAGLGVRGWRYLEVGIGMALVGLGGGLDLRYGLNGTGGGGIRARGKCHQGRWGAELGFFGIMGGDGAAFCHKRRVIHKKLGFLAQTGMSVLPQVGTLAVTGWVTWARVGEQIPVDTVGDG